MKKEIFLEKHCKNVKSEYKDAWKSSPIKIMLKSDKLFSDHMF